MNKKFLLATVLIIIVAVVVTLARFSGGKNVTSVDTVDTVKGIVHGKSQISESNPTTQANSTASPFEKVKQQALNKRQDEPTLEELAGPVHNEHGIRDDIYKYIQSTIPPDNEKAMKAAITYAATAQFMYYQATKEEATKADQKMFIALTCLEKSNINDEPLAIADKINKLMINTKEREKYLLEIDEKYFGWKVLGSGNLTSEDIEKICEKGNY